MQLEKARRAKSEKLDGKSPRQRGTEKMHAALEWVYRWGWSSASILESVVGTKESGIASRLIKKGMLVSTKSQSGGGIKGVPANILTLSETGLSEVERVTEKLLPYTISPFSIDQRLLRHDSTAQNATIKAITQKKIDSFQTPKEISQKSITGVKQPDILWIKGSTRVAVEVELTGKWERDLDFFIRGCLKSLFGYQDNPPTAELIAIISDSKAIINRYQKAFTPESKYGIWEKDESRHWKKIGEKRMPTEITGKIICDLIEIY